MHHLRTLIAIAGLAAFGYASAQNVPCPGETLSFQLEGEYYGTKTWEYSADGVSWNAVDVVENTPFVLQPEQSGWYRVRFHDESCDINYFSEPQRFVAHSIDLGGTVTISVGGVVRNEGGGPIVGAIVRAGCGAGVSTTTDRFGVFKLNGVEVHEGLATLTVEKEGYFTGSRSFVPSDSSGHALSYAYVTLLSEIDRGTVNGVLGGTINGLGGVVFTFPPNSFVQNGSPYMGNVIVRNNYVRPTDPEMHMKMPGLLLGVDEGGAQVLQSYGMSVTELVDDNGQAVQLAPDVLVGMRIPFPSSLSSTAPPVIPLWYYDEDLGYWIQEGEAMLVLGSYVGQVSHFSWWNIDVPSDFVMLDGVVVDSGLDSVLQGARVILNSTTIGTAIAYTDASGAFSGFVPLGQELAIQVQMQCGENGEWVTVHGETIGPFQVASSVVLASTSPSHFVGGVVVDCDQIAVEEGYVLANGVVHFCESGTFSVYACWPTLTLRGVDLALGNVSELDTFQLIDDVTNVGVLTACTSMFGSVTDVNGNSYQTVLIGSQWWMAENLRSVNYANGDPIINHNSSSNWNSTTNGAWVHYSNNSSYDIPYGKLYNFFAVNDVRNVCPAGWHTPSGDEWDELSDFLGGDAVAGGAMKSTDSQYWSSPNVGATNDSGFSGMPGGWRSSLTGYFEAIGYWSYYWEAGGVPLYDCWARSMDQTESDLDRSSRNARAGYSVRCVRD